MPICGRGHPLANEKSVTREQLSEYPCMTFEQGENSSFYLTEEVFNTADMQDGKG